MCDVKISANDVQDWVEQNLTMLTEAYQKDLKENPSKVWTQVDQDDIFRQGIFACKWIEQAMGQLCYDRGYIATARISLLKATMALATLRADFPGCFTTPTTEFDLAANVFNQAIQSHPPTYAQMQQIVMTGSSGGDA